jgi:hypothetical protein
MTQHIGLCLINEQNEIKENSVVNFACVNRALYADPKNEQKYSWLWTIDEYDNTIFNRLQIPHVISELSEFRDEVSDQEVVGEIDLTIEFLRKVGDLQYAKFVGD